MALPREAIADDVSLVPMPARPLTLEDFSQLSTGDVVRVFYWTVNQGDMLYRFDRVADGRVYGQLCDDRHVDVTDDRPDWLVRNRDEFENKPFWGEVAGYLYDFGGLVCRGSGAEPVHGTAPSTCFLECQ